jgi:hypothetical protein
MLLVMTRTDLRPKKNCDQVQANIWPTEDLPELEDAFKTMGKLVYEAAKPVVRQVDELCRQDRMTRLPSIEHSESRGSDGDRSCILNTDNVTPSNSHDGILYRRTFPESKLVVARLLHYYAISEDQAVEEWCGWHNDNSTITGLVPAMWLDEESGEEVGNGAFKAPTDAGLFVEGRNGEQVKVKIPTDCLGFQIGEASQILSGGVVHATPHMVKGHVRKEGEPKISRETFAVFIEPSWDGLLEPPTISAEKMKSNNFNNSSSTTSPASSDSEKSLSSKESENTSGDEAVASISQASFDAIFKGREESKLIPPLRTRLEKVPVKFGDFLQNSFKLYYEMNNP